MGLGAGALWAAMGLVLPSETLSSRKTGGREKRYCRMVRDVALAGPGYGSLQGARRRCRNAREDARGCMQKAGFTAEPVS
jgi:hypothetical protein